VIFNALGKEVFSKNNIAQKNIIIDISRFAPGLYSYKLFTLNNEQNSGSFIVQ
jgi:hypothetical protein